MRLFTSPYVLLALAGSSALAVPLIASERDGGSIDVSTQTPSSPATLMGRQPIGLGVGPELTSIQAVGASPPNYAVEHNSNIPAVGTSPPNYAVEHNSNIPAVGTSPNYAVEHTSNEASNTCKCDPNWQQKESQYVEGATRRRSDGQSDISERGAAKKKITKEDLFRHFFRKAVTGKGKGNKRSPSVTFDREVS